MSEKGYERGGVDKTLFIKKDKCGIVIAIGGCCTQLLWMKQMLADYGIVQDTLVVYCDNTSAINISKNHVQYSRTKHIDIRHHFIRELVENKTVVIEYVQQKINWLTFSQKLLTHPDLIPKRNP